MTNNDYLSQRTRAFRKGVLIFSSFMVLTISYNLRVTEIPAFGIKDIDPEIVFTGNLAALAYLFISYLIYYSQDRLHHVASDSHTELITKANDRSKKYLDHITEYLNKLFICPPNDTEGKQTDATKSHILRVLMKDQLDYETVRESLRNIITNYNERLLTGISVDKACSNLANDRSNYISGKEGAVRLMSTQLTIDRIVTVLDFWLPVLAAIMAFAVYVLRQA